MTRSIQYSYLDFLVHNNMTHLDINNNSHSHSQSQSQSHSHSHSQSHPHTSIFSNTAIAYDTDGEEILDAVDEMYEEDSAFVESDKVPNQMLLATVVYLPSDPYVQQLGLAVSPELYMEYPYQQLTKYIKMYSAQYRMYTSAVLSHISNIKVMKKLNETRQQNDQVDIVCIVNEPNGVMVTDTIPMQIVIIKTFWLRILQRTWKRKYNALLERIKIMKNPEFLRNRECAGHIED